MDQISFIQQYEFGPFLKLAFYRYFSRPLLLILYAFWLLFTLVSIFQENPFFSTNSLIFSVAFLVLLPWALYRNTKALFLQHYMFQDEVKFTLTDKQISLKGSGFESQLDWDLIHYVKEYPGWIMIFPSRNNAYYLHRSQVDPMDWEILRSIVKGRTEISSRLRKD